MVVRQRSFFPRNRDGVKECLQRRLAEARAALMRSLLVVAFDPYIEVVLQIPDRGIEPLSEGEAIELVQHCLVEALSDAIRLWTLRLGPGWRLPADAGSIGMAVDAAGWGGLAAFFAHPALIALAIARCVVAPAS
jgi:hypothetical protein